MQQPENHVALQLMQNTTEVWIQARPEEAFALFVRVDLFPRWNSGFIELRPLEGEPTTSGSLFEMVYREMGRKVVMKEKINERRDSSLYTGESWNSDLHIRFRYEFLTQGQGCLMKLSTHIQTKSLSARALGGAILQTMRRIQRNNLHRFKALVEKNRGSAQSLSGKSASL
jgi:Polyketide cyclase / dehydrase and lipid transport.